MRWLVSREPFLKGNSDTWWQNAMRPWLILQCAGIFSFINLIFILIMLYQISRCLSYQVGPLGLRNQRMLHPRDVFFELLGKWLATFWRQLLCPLINWMILLSRKFSQCEFFFRFRVFFFSSFFSLLIAIDVISFSTWFHFYQKQKFSSCCIHVIRCTYFQFLGVFGYKLWVCG